jgi:hypothetical protein
MAQFIITASDTVDLSPERIWRVLDDFARWPAWMPGLEHTRVELLSEGPPREDYRFRLRGPAGYADLSVTECAPLARATNFRLSFPPLTGANRCTLEPLPDGGYRLQRSDTIEIPGLLVALLAPQRPRFEGIAAAFIAALGREARREPGPAT